MDTSKDSWLGIRSSLLRGCSSPAAPAALHASDSSCNRRCHSDEGGQKWPRLSLTLKRNAGGGNTIKREEVSTLQCAADVIETLRRAPASADAADAAAAATGLSTAQITRLEMQNYSVALFPVADMTSASGSRASPSPPLRMAAAPQKAHRKPSSAAAAADKCNSDCGEKQKKPWLHHRPRRLSLSSSHKEALAAPAAALAAVPAPKEEVLGDAVVTYKYIQKRAAAQQQPRERESGGGLVESAAAASAGLTLPSTRLSVLPLQTGRAVASPSARSRTTAAREEEADESVCSADAAARASRATLTDDTVFGLYEDSLYRAAAAATADHRNSLPASTVDGANPSHAAGVSVGVAVADSRSACAAAVAAPATARHRQQLNRAALRLCQGVLGGEEEEEVSSACYSEEEQEKKNGRAERRRIREEQGDMSRRRAAALTHVTALQVGCPKKSSWRENARAEIAVAPAATTAAAGSFSTWRRRLRRHPVAAAAGQTTAAGPTAAADHTAADQTATVTEDYDAFDASERRGFAGSLSACTAMRALRPGGVAATFPPLQPQPQRGKQECEALEDREEKQDEQDYEDRSVVQWSRRKENKGAERLWRLSVELLDKLRHSSHNKARLLVLLGEEAREKLRQKQTFHFESGKRLSGRGFFYALLTFFLLVLALVLLLGTLQHQHKLYRLRPRQVLLLQQKTQQQLQQRMLQEQQGGREVDERWQQVYEASGFHIPPLRRCPPHTRSEAKANPRKQRHAATACLAQQEKCSSEGETYSIPSSQTCPKVQGDTALLASAATTATHETPQKRKTRICLSTKPTMSTQKRRRKARIAMRSTSATGSTWLGLNLLDACCVPVAAAPLYSPAIHRASVQAGPSMKPASNPSSGATHLIASDVTVAAATGGFKANGAVGDFAAAAQMTFPHNVFFFSLHGHPPPLSFLDPASPVLVCAEAEEGQLLRRLLLQLLRPFQVVSDATLGLLRLLVQHVRAATTQWHSQQQQPNADGQCTPVPQQQGLQKPQEHCCGEQRHFKRGKTQQEDSEEGLLISAAGQESAAAASHCIEACGGDDDTCSENTTAAADERTPAARHAQATQETELSALHMHWEMQIVRVLEDGSNSCSSDLEGSRGRDDTLVASSEANARDAGDLQGLQERERTAAAVVLSHLDEEPRIQLYTQTLRACFSGLLPQYSQRRFAVISSEAAVLLDEYRDAALPAAASSAIGSLLHFPAAVAKQHAQSPSFLSPPLTGASLTAGAAAVSFAAADSRGDGDRPVAAVLFCSPVAAAASDASAVAVPMAAAELSSSTDMASSPAAGSNASSSGVLLTRLSSLLPADISLYFSFSSYLSPCYPFSRFLHRRLVGWGGLQLHLLLFGGWLHSLFAAEPLTLVHAPRAAFLFILAVYRGLILYEAFSSLEAHFFRKAHKVQQQEHLRTAAAAADETQACASVSELRSGRHATREIEELEDMIFFENEEEENWRSSLQQQRQQVQAADAIDMTSRRGSSSSSSNSDGGATPDDETGKVTEEHEDHNQQHHRSARQRQKETGGKRTGSSDQTYHPELESEYVAAAAWTDFSDHVVLYVLVVIFAAMEIAAARSSHARPRSTPGGSHSNSSNLCCSNSSNSSNDRSNNNSNSYQIAHHCQGGDGASPAASEERCRCGDYFPSRSFLTPVSEQCYEEEDDKVGEEALASSTSSTSVALIHSTVSDGAATGDRAAPDKSRHLPACNSNSSTEAPMRHHGGRKLYFLVWIYYGFLLLCCFHMAFYTASFFHTPQEIWSGLGVGMLFLVLPLVIACEVLEKPTLQRLGIGSGERRAATRAPAADAAHGGAAGGASTNREPTGSSKRFAGAEATAAKEDGDEDEEEEEIGFSEDDRLSSSSSSSSLSVRSRSSSSSSNCSRLRERPAAAATRLLPVYRRRPHVPSSSGSNSSHGATSPLSAFVPRQQKQQQLALRHSSLMTRTRSSHSRRREDSSSSSRFLRSRKRSSSNRFSSTAAAATPGRIVPEYNYCAPPGGHSLLQQHEDTVAIR